MSEPNQEIKSQLKSGVATKVFSVLIVSVIGWSVFQWIKGNVDITAQPLAQLTLSDIGKVILLIVLASFFVKIIIAIISEN